MRYKEIVAVCVWNPRKTQMHCGQNTEFLNVKAGGT